MYKFKDNFDFNDYQHKNDIYRYAIKDYIAQDGSKVGIKYIMDCADNVTAYFVPLPSMEMLQKEMNCSIVTNTDTSGYLSAKNIVRVETWDNYNISTVKSLEKLMEINKALIQKLGYKTSDETIDEMTVPSSLKSQYRSIARLIKSTRKLVTLDELIEIAHNSNFFECLWYEASSGKQVYGVTLIDDKVSFSSKCLALFNEEELSKIDVDIRLFNKFNKQEEWKRKTKAI